MAEPHHPTDAELERRLRALGRQLDYPSAPNLPSAVRAEIAGRTSTGRRPWWRRLLGRPRLVPAGLALVAALALVLALAPGARRAMADRLGVPGIQLRFGPLPGTPTPARPSGAAFRRTPAAATPTPMSGGWATSVSARLNLGTPLTLAEARVRLPYAPKLPRDGDLPPPDAAFLRNGDQLALAWQPRPTLPAVLDSGVGLLLIQFPGREPTAALKGVPRDATVEPVEVDGRRGQWIGGAAHSFAYRDPESGTTLETLRLAGQTLLWTRDGLTLRLESALDRDAALRIAEDVR